jgi:3-phosphoshikimate 1-carboxyvinyltransferase
VHLFVREATRPLTGAVFVPSSKYHAHRALMLASLAQGTSRVVGVSDARHVRSTIEVLRGLGVGVDVEPDGFEIHGGPYTARRETLSVGSSGTTLYFMIGLASLADAPVTLTGQKYFQRRPVGPLLEALGQLGVELSAEGARPPITVQPRRPTGGRARISGTLSQWISGLLMIAPFASGPSTIEVEGELNERPYVELTVGIMRQFGLEIDVKDNWRRFEVAGDQQAIPTTVALPPDIASAAFGLAASALHPCDVLFRGLTETRAERLDHPEAHVLEVLEQMGLPMALDAEAGGVRVSHDGVELGGVEVDCRPMPDMLPVLATLGTFARGTTTFYNIEHVRLKESDRIVSMLQLNEMGGDLEVQGDRLVVRGVRALRGASLSSYNDHRVHMALAVAASRAAGESSLTYPNAYRISYPAFLDDMSGLGIPMRIEADGRRRGRTGSPQGPEAVESVAVDRAAGLPIGEWVRRWAAERPAENAIVDVRASGTRAWSWRALDEAADRTAMLLLELGVEPGEPVAYQLPNWGEFVVLTLAALRIGAVCCPLMPIFRAREVEHALRCSGARVLVIAESFRGRDHLAETVALLDHYDSLAPLGVEHVLVIPNDSEAVALPAGSGAVDWQDFAAAIHERPVDRAALQARRPAANDLAQLLFTSGTSGEPKGVLHRFDALTRAAAMEIEHLGLGRDERIFVPSPLAHQTGFLYGMWLAFVLGCTQILQDVWEPLRAARALREWGGSFVQAATPFLSDLVRAVEEGEHAPSALRIFVVTGASVPRVLAERGTRVLDADVCGAWGSTESCLGALAAPGDDPELVWGTDGRALAGVRLRVTDDDGSVLAAGREGHFELYSRCMFERYLDRPDLTAQAFTPDGWYRTGDLATIDAAGYLRITGRVKDIVNRGGEKIPVAEIEQLLHRHPEVEEVAIVAMPDQRLGERACAFAVLREGAEFDLAAMRDYLDRLSVARQYWPERLEPIEQLPRNPTGKVQKFLLRERTRSFLPLSPALAPSTDASRS